ncbi:MAG: hypothetical protein KAT15_11860, partial [Bacteroidales bacterium]|nr:hypothetical protein [Bacteroidales bacterium]
MKFQRGTYRIGRLRGTWTWTSVLLILTAGIILSSCEDLLGDQDSGDPRDKLVDTWKCDETPGTYKSALDVYWVEISKHLYDSTRIVIYNFYNVDAEAEAVLNGNALTLPLQMLEGGFQVSGSGQIQGSKANEII